MDTAGLSDQKRESKQISWINQGLFKAFIAGFILGAGLLLSAVVTTNFMIQPESITKQMFIDLGVPIISVYLVANLVKNFLKLYGFEGFVDKSGEGLTVSKLAIAMPGCIVGAFGVTVLVFALTITYQKIGDDGIGALVGFVMIGALAFTALRRRAKVQDRGYWTNLLLFALIFLVPSFLYLISFFLLSYRSF